MQGQKKDFERANLSLVDDMAHGDVRFSSFERAALHCFMGLEGLGIGEKEENLSASQLTCAGISKAGF